MKDIQIPVPNFQIELAASQSKLNNEKDILEILRQSWRSQIKESSDQTLYVRVNDDNFSVSMDTSGEHLHKRGYKKFSGEAPIRETIAAYMLYKLIGSLGASELKDINLIDPMAGSGTFLFEANELFKPHFQRKFAFQSWKSVPKIFSLEGLVRNYFFNPTAPFKALLGFDKDPKMVQAMQENNKILGSALQIHQGDLIDKSSLMQGRNWVICNPPYGERLEMNFSWEQFLDAIEARYNPERMAVIVSAQQKTNFEKALLKSRLNFLGEELIRNGGMATHMYLASGPKPS